MSEVLKKYKSILLYLIFGCLTTIVNIAVYVASYDFFNISNFWSTAAAWLISVLFAFVTNRKWVFESKNNSCIKELISFFCCRAITGITDIVIMVIAVDIMGWNSLLWKILSNIIVIILNYIASKFFVFKKRNKQI